MRQAQALDPALEGRDVRVIGHIDAMPQPGADGQRFVLAVEQASADGAPVVLPPRLALNWYGPAQGGVAARPDPSTSTADAGMDEGPGGAVEAARAPPLGYA